MAEQRERHAVGSIAVPAGCCNRAAPDTELLASTPLLGPVMVLRTTTGLLMSERGRHFSWLGHITPALLVLATFILASALGAALVVKSIDQAHAQRERQMLYAALDIQLAQLEAIAQDNATSDWVALAIRQAPLDHKAIELTWREYTERADIYSGMFVLDAQGHLSIGMVRGRVLPEAGGTSWLPVMRGMRQRYANGNGTRSGLLSFRGKVTLVAVSDVRPHSRAYRGPAGPPARFAFTKQVNESVLQQLNNSLQLDRLRLAEVGTLARDGQTQLLLRDVGGIPIGTLIWFPRRPGVAALLGEAPTLLAILCLCLCVTALVGWTNLIAARRLVHAAYCDSLSGLPNRRRFAEVLDRSLDRAGPLAVAVIDLDDFKAVNDEHGHPTGDALIRNVGQQMLEMSSQGAIAFRLGGDEFAVIVSGSGCEDRIKRVAGDLLDGLRLDAPNGRSVQISASVGLANNAGGVTAGELLRRADLALYDAKGKGKSQMRWYDADLDRRLLAAQTLGREMRQAIGTDAFEVVYQPIVTSHDRCIVGVEALLRFVGKSGPVCPSVFIPVAEQTGLIEDLGLFVLDRACADIAPLTDIKVAVNVSGAQLRNPRFAEDVAASCARHGLSPMRLELEITESYLLSDPEITISALRRLQSIGISLSLDDFGTGFASIGFLRRFAFDLLKLDRSLVVGALDEGPSTKLVKASVAIAEALQMSVVAEGVDSAEVAAAMQKLGCERMQGWLFGKAMKYHALKARLAYGRRELPLATLEEGSALKVR